MCEKREKTRWPYLFPFARLPLGTASAPAAPPLDGFGRHTLAVLLGNAVTGGAHAANFTGLEASSAGGGALPGETQGNVGKVLN